MSLSSARSFHTSGDVSGSARQQEMRLFSEVATSWVRFWRNWDTACAGGGEVRWVEALSGAWAAST